MVHSMLQPHLLDMETIVSVEKLCICAKQLTNRIFQQKGTICIQQFTNCSLKFEECY